jgi:hypothetical protein
MPEDPATPAGAPTGTPGQQPSDGAGSVPSPQSSEPEIANPEAKKYADEAARIRHELKAAQKELTELRTFKQQVDDGKLSADEKRDKALAEAQQRANEAEERAQRVAVRAEIKGVAQELKLNHELALELLDWSKITFNEDGDPTNVAELLAAKATKYGLIAPADNAATNGKPPARPQPTSVGSVPANPARSASSGAPAGGWSWEAISSLTKEQYEGLSPAQRIEMSRFIASHPQR